MVNRFPAWNSRSDVNVIVIGANKRVIFSNSITCGEDRRVAIQRQLSWCITLLLIPRYIDMEASGMFATWMVLREKRLVIDLTSTLFCRVVLQIAR